jgi:hypothetical protein
MATRKTGGQIGEVVIEQLRENVLAGIPHRQPRAKGEERGYADLIYLSNGHFYPVTDFIKTPDDQETAFELWAALREEMILSHIERQPRSRPWAFYALEDREPRRRLDRKLCTCPPGANFHGLPPLSWSWFGKRRGCRCEHEDESDYLKRLGLLTKQEKKF